MTAIPLSTRFGIIHQMVSVLMLVALILGIVTKFRYDDHWENNLATAQTVSLANSDKIARLLAEQQRLVGLWEVDNHGLVAALLAEPDNDELRLEMETRLARYFPDYFAFSITSEAGVPIMVDFDGHLGQLCLSNVQRFAETHEHEFVIHPNPHVYHFDTMATWHDEHSSGILLVSFKPDELAEILRLGQAPTQELVLVTKDDSMLVEVTPLGSRDSLPPGEDYRLPEDFRSRILHTDDVPGTAWRLVTAYEQAAFTGYRTGLYKQMFFLFVAFALVIVGMGWQVYRKEIQRRKSEVALLKSHARIFELNEEVEQRNQSLEQKQAVLDQEVMLAKAVFDKITNLSSNDVSFVNPHLSPVSTFNGDLMLAYQHPRGKRYLMLCDFTGHGLPAAIGAIPTSMMFFEKSQAGAPIKQIAEDINEKLSSLLPVERFCCAILIEYDPKSGLLQVLNAGLPECFLLGEDRSIRKRFVSNSLPLGVDASLDADIQQLHVTSAEHLFLYTDGLIEASTENDEVFGQQRLEATLSAGGDFHELCSEVERSLEAYCSGSIQTDDISFAVVNFSEYEDQLIAFRAPI